MLSASDFDDEVVLEYTNRTLLGNANLNLYLKF